MKIITIILSTIVINACGGAKEASAEAVSETASKTETVVESPKNMQDETVVFEYSAVSRGVFKQVKVTKELVSIQASRGQKAETKECSPELWNKLTSLLKDVDLEAIPKYEAPSKAHQVDGALSATLKVTHQGKTYETQTFDHGKPQSFIV